MNQDTVIQHLLVRQESGHSHTAPVGETGVRTVIRHLLVRQESQLQLGKKKKKKKKRKKWVVVRDTTGEGGRIYHRF
jgi:hypothetical protein